MDAAIMAKLNLPDGTAFNRYQMWSLLKVKVEGLVEALHYHNGELAVER